MSGTHLYDPGCVGNASDGMSCMHACIQMVMRTRQGGRVFSFDEINTILRRKPGLYSWSYAIADAVSQQGFSVRSVSTFATQRFVMEGAAYLRERYGLEAGAVQIAHTDLPTVVDDARKFLENSSIERQERVPEMEDLCRLLDEGWYVVPLVNSKRLNDQDGYSGHFVFVYGYDASDVIFHDPGLPPLVSRRTSWDAFEQAWSSPTKSVRSLMAYRPR